MPICYIKSVALVVLRLSGNWGEFSVEKQKGKLVHKKQTQKFIYKHAIFLFWV